MEWMEIHNKDSCLVETIKENMTSGRRMFQIEPLPLRESRSAESSLKKLPRTLRITIRSSLTNGLMFSSDFNLYYIRIRRRLCLVHSESKPSDFFVGYMFMFVVIRDHLSFSIRDNWRRVPLPEND
jgi:hypothetical protein